MKQSIFALVVIALFVSVEPAGADDGATGPEVGQAERDLSAADAPRPAALTPLLAAYAGLQALDISSTYSMNRAGTVEANPVVRQALASPVALIAMKAGAAALTIAVANRVAKNHPKAAVLLMIGVNSAYVTIVAHNYAVAR